LENVREGENLSGGFSRPRRKPPNPGYQVSAVPKRYVDQVQLSAVLRPVYGRLRTDTDIIDATAWTLHYWRARASMLAEAHCYPFAPKQEGGRQRLPNAMACPVAFVMTFDGKKGRKPCSIPTICPFCWARDVREQWLNIDEVFFPPPRDQRIRMVDIDHEPAKSTSFTHRVKDVERGAKSPYDLIRRAFTFHLPAVYRVQGAPGRFGYGDFKMHGMSFFLKSRTQGWPYPSMHRAVECRELLEPAGPVSGLLEAIHFRRVADDEAGEPWEVQVRQLILATDATKVPQAMPKESFPPYYHRVTSRPGRRAVVSAVAKTLHYPNWLIDPHVPVDRIVEYLAIRRDLRLIANYGRFRTKHT
jgi:hypothetical protein